MGGPSFFPFCSFWESFREGMRMLLSFSWSQSCLFDTCLCSRTLCMSWTSLIDLLLWQTEKWSDQILIRIIKPKRIPTSVKSYYLLPHWHTLQIYQTAKTPQRNDQKKFLQKTYGWHSDTCRTSERMVFKIFYNFLVSVTQRQKYNASTYQVLLSFSWLVWYFVANGSMCRSVVYSRFGAILLLFIRTGPLLSVIDELSSLLMVMSSMLWWRLACTWWHMTTNTPH